MPTGTTTKVKFFVRWCTIPVSRHKHILCASVCVCFCFLRAIVNSTTCSPQQSCDTSCYDTHPFIVLILSERPSLPFSLCVLVATFLFFCLFFGWSPCLDEAYSSSLFTDRKWQDKCGGRLAGEQMLAFCGSLNGSFTANGKGGLLRGWGLGVGSPFLVIAAFGSELITAQIKRFCARSTPPSPASLPLSPFLYRAATFVSATSHFRPCTLTSPPSFLLPVPFPHLMMTGLALQSGSLTSRGWEKENKLVTAVCRHQQEGVGIRVNPSREGRVWIIAPASFFFVVVFLESCVCLYVWGWKHISCTKICSSAPAGRKTGWLPPLSVRAMSLRHWHDVLGEIKTRSKISHWTALPRRWWGSSVLIQGQRRRINGRHWSTETKAGLRRDALKLRWELPSNLLNVHSISLKIAQISVFWYLKGPHIIPIFFFQICIFHPRRLTLSISRKTAYPWGRRGENNKSECASDEQYRWVHVFSFISSGKVFWFNLDQSIHFHIRVLLKPLGLWAVFVVHGSLAEKNDLHPPLKMKIGLTCIRRRRYTILINAKDAHTV